MKLGEKMGKKAILEEPSLTERNRPGSAGFCPGTTDTCGMFICYVCFLIYQNNSRFSAFKIQVPSLLLLFLLFS